MTRAAAGIAAALITGMSPAIAESGIASVYNDQKTACGEPFVAASMTVAHPLGKTAAMPCGTCLRIEFEGREIEVRVVDNGPHIKGRKIDMTPGVARRLRFPGLGRVRFWRIACSDER